MAWRRSFAVLCSVCLLGEGFAAPAQFSRGRRADAVADNEVTSKELTVASDKSDTTTTTSPITSAFTTEEIGRSVPITSGFTTEETGRSVAESSPNSASESSAETSAETAAETVAESSPESSPPSSPPISIPSVPPPSPPEDDDDDDEDFADLPAAPAGGGGGGSNLFSLLNLVGSLFPGSSGTNVQIRNMIKTVMLKHQHVFDSILPRKDGNNKIEIDHELKPPKAPELIKLNIGNLKFPKINFSQPLKSVKPVKNVKPIRQEIEESDSDTDTNESDSSNEASDENDAAEEGADNNGNGNGNGVKEDSKEDNSDYDSDEPPGGGDGQGGGLLGLLAGLSGGEDGQSDLGSLLATVGGIVANLSGDGFDLNAVIATALGLFVGLLSEGNENPGTVIANYLLTSLDTITEGGAQNNGAFFGKFISKLVKGTSAVPAGSDEDENMMKMPMTDSAGFLASFLSALLGEMSKGSSGGWR